MNSHSPKYAFYYLTAFFSLGFVAFGIGMLCFQFVNYFFPEEFSSRSSLDIQSSIKLALSLLFVSVPVFFFLMRKIYIGIEREEIDLDNGVRKWLTYALLFVVSAVIVGDLVTLFYNFLDGEATIRFFLKGIIIFLIAGGIFLHFFGDLKEQKIAQRKKFRILWQWLFLLGTTAIFIGGLFLIESPMVAKERKIDLAIASDLSQIDQAFQSFYQERKALPSSPEELFNIPNVYISEQTLNDLKENNFSYTKNSDVEYTLCAIFKRSNKDDSNLYDPYREWNHDAGEVCFQRKIPANILDSTITKPIFQ
jgi:uncharacterized membrane protein YidH (DUF202 family)